MPDIELNSRLLNSSKLINANIKQNKQNSKMKNVNEIHQSFYFQEKGLHISNLNIQHILPKLDEIRLHLANNIVRYIWAL
jgi:hypothetical protein